MTKFGPVFNRAVFSEERTAIFSSPCGTLVAGWVEDIEDVSLVGLVLQSLITLYQTVLTLQMLFINDSGMLIQVYDSKMWNHVQLHLT